MCKQDTPELVIRCKLKTVKQTGLCISVIIINIQLSQWVLFKPFEHKTFFHEINNCWTNNSSVINAFCTCCIHYFVYSHVKRACFIKNKYENSAKGNFFRIIEK